MTVLKYASVICAVVLIIFTFLWINFQFWSQPDDGYRVWWNVPTKMCHKHGLNFSEITAFGLEQNTDDTFLGDKISILYDPGLFPSLEDGGRNGDVPQEGNLQLHLEKFTETVNNSIPNDNFSGLGIIDFEHWRPIWRENWGKLDAYRVKSVEIEKKKHPTWTESKIRQSAMTRFEKAGFTFFEDTLQRAKNLRSRAKWGYYGYPFCFNYTPKNPGMYCSADVQKDNDRSSWLQNMSTALYPSIYLYTKDVAGSKRPRFIEGRLNEALRISKKVKPNLPVIPYATYKYPDSSNFYSKTDMSTSILLPKKLGAAGVIIWGSSKDTSSKEKCQKLFDYADRVIRPIIKQALQNY